MASLQMTKTPLQGPKNPQATCNDIAEKPIEMEKRLEEKKPEQAGANWVVSKVKVESVESVENNQQQQQLMIKPLEDDHIEQMIEELLHYGSIELINVN